MKKPTNGVVNILNEQQERMRQQVVDLELKARYWKATYEIKNYTLLCEEIEPKYAEWTDLQAKKNEEAMKAFQERAKEVQDLASNGQIEEKQATVYDETDATIPVQ